MKDMYSFDVDRESAMHSYKLVSQAYHRIFKSLGAECVRVDADSGSIGGDNSHEFHICADTGEDVLLHCDSCDYAANRERAVSRLPAKSLSSLETRVESVIDDSTGHVYSIMIPSGRDIQILSLNRFMEKPRILSDDEVKSVMSSKTDYDQKLVDENAYELSSEQFKSEVDTSDLYTVGNFLTSVEGDRCCAEGCIEGTLKERKGIEVAHVFYLGKKYSEAMNATFRDAHGVEQCFEMGCFGIGATRVMAALVESSHDEKGIVWPARYVHRTSTVAKLKAF